MNAQHRFILVQRPRAGDAGRWGIWDCLTHKQTGYGSDDQARTEAKIHTLNHPLEDETALCIATPLFWTPKIDGSSGPTNWNEHAEPGWFRILM